MTFVIGGRGLKMNGEGFGLLDLCYAELDAKQDYLINEYQLGSYEKSFYDQERKVLQFINENQELLEFYVIIIGTWSPKSNTWMWAWENSSMTVEVQKEASAMKELAEITGLNIFETPFFQCKEGDAFDITALAVHHLNAIGMYQVPEEDSHLFLAIMREKKFFN